MDDNEDCNIDIDEEEMLEDDEYLNISVSL